MPLYIARGPATLAFLIRADHPSQVYYVIDSVTDPGGFEVEEYDGPLNLALDLPASIVEHPDDSSPESDVKIKFTGGRAFEDLCHLPEVVPVTEMYEDWQHLRDEAFPRFTELAQEFDYESTPDGQIPAELLERAIAADVSRQLARARRQQDFVSDNEAKLRRNAGVSVSLDTLLEGGQAHAKMVAEGCRGSSEDSAQPERIAEAVERFGAVAMKATADGIVWGVGDPIIGSGSTLLEAMADGAT